MNVALLRKPGSKAPHNAILDRSGADAANSLVQSYSHGRQMNEGGPYPEASAPVEQRCLKIGESGAPHLRAALEQLCTVKQC